MSILDKLIAAGLYGCVDVGLRWKYEDDKEFEIIAVNEDVCTYKVCDDGKVFATDRYELQKSFRNNSRGLPRPTVICLNAKNPAIPLEIINDSDAVHDYLLIDNYCFPLTTGDCAGIHDSQIESIWKNQ